MRTMQVKVTFNVTIKADEELELQEIIDDLTVEGNGEVDGYYIENSEIEDSSIEDSH